MVRFVSASEAVALLRGGMTVGIGGFGAYACPDGLLTALAQRFHESREPRGLTLVTGITPGPSRKSSQGLALLKEPGLIDTMITGHLANAPEIAAMVGADEIAGYALPLGVVMHLFRAIAGKKPGVLTHEIGRASCRERV